MWHIAILHDNITNKLLASLTRTNKRTDPALEDSGRFTFLAGLGPFVDMIAAADSRDTLENLFKLLIPQPLLLNPVGEDYCYEAHDTYENLALKAKEDRETDE